MSDILFKSIHFPQLDARYIVGDDTLSEEGAAADAKETGDALALKADKTDTYTKAQVDTKVGDAKSELEEAIDDLDERKAEIDGYYETFTSGQTEQIIATEAITDTEPYNHRKTGGPNDVGDRVYDTLVGGSVVWNQFVPTNKKSGTITPSASSSYYSSAVVASGAIIDHVYFMKASFNYKGDKTVVGFLQAGNLPGIEYSSTLVKNTNTTFSAVLKRPTGASTAFVIGINTVDHSINLDDTDVWNYDDLYGIDLTAALGSTIADYVYTLETATAGAGVAWFKKYFPEVYCGYTEPHFEHVQVSAKNTVGFNQWDEVWENGAILNGEDVASPTTIRSKNYNKCLPNTEYYVKSPQPIFVNWYDENKQFLSRSAGVKNVVLTFPDGACYFRVAGSSNYGATYNHDICINIHGDRDGEYEPYKKRTYPLDSSLTLRGIPKLDSANRLYFDGDIYRHDGSGEYRYLGVDLGTINWQKVTGNNYATFSSFAGAIDIKYDAAKVVFTNYGKYAEVTNNTAQADADNYIWINASKQIRIKDTSKADMTAEQFKAAMSGVFLTYEKATPEPFTAEPFQSPMVVDPLGTEEFIDYGVEQGTRDVAIPVGHNSEYPADLRGKLQRLPSPTGTNGDYIVTEVDGKLYLKPYVPAVGLTAPTTEGEGE